MPYVRQLRWITLALLLTVVALASRGRAANINDFAVFNLTSGPTTLLRGRLYVPPEASHPGPRPLILFMHGAGESGTNNTLQVNGNIDNLLAEAKRRGAFLYAPQTNNGWGNATTNQRVVQSIDIALAQYNVDPRKLYVTGLSMGGGGTWNMLDDYGDRFAAGVPICAVAPVAPFSAAGMLDEPIWAFHARNDGTVSVGASRSVFNGLLAAGGELAPTYLPGSTLVDSHFASANHDLQYTEYYTGGHGIWGRVYNTQAMYEWLFSHTSVPEPAGATLVTLATTLLCASRRRSTWFSCKRSNRVAEGGDASAFFPG
jgi:predicted peptidase